ncbi:hypothetical protein GUI12_01815 [Anaplasmataceae bacterium AB001_6]|nr:hypothetical protein GUI12_01815 [Anaplasmataceae bacterium AB001_6]
MEKKYDVIIIGAGPVGSALAIELGLHNIKTLVVEKKSIMQKRNRMVSLSIRSAELCTRWKVLDKINSTNTVKNGLPIRCAWSSSLNGELYVDAEYENISEDNVTCHSPIRMLLHEVEDIFRQRMLEFSSVQFMSEHELKDIEVYQDLAKVTLLDKKANKNIQISSSFVACADGANGISKNIFDNRLIPLSDSTPMLNVYFKSRDIFIDDDKPKVMLYIVINEKISGALSIVNVKENTFVVQFIIDAENAKNISEDQIGEMIDNFSGHKCEKEIIEYGIWDMCPQIAEKFTHKDRIIWLGDAAHAFAPTGGMGLNTGLGDSYNLGWKIYNAINNPKKRSEIINSYVQERLHVWKNNLNYARGNALAITKIKEKYPPHRDFARFVRENIAIGKKLMSSSKLNLGYNYKKMQNIQYTDNLKYISKIDEGFFFPEIFNNIDKSSIYHLLCPRRWNLLIFNSKNGDQKDHQLINKLNEKYVHIIYINYKHISHTYIYLRPDWHIELMTNNIEDIHNLNAGNFV